MEKENTFKPYEIINDKAYDANGEVTGFDSDHILHDLKIGDRVMCKFRDCDVKLALNDYRNSRLMFAVIKNGKTMYFYKKNLKPIIESSIEVAFREKFTFLTSICPIKDLNSINENI